MIKNRRNFNFDSKSAWWVVKDNIDIVVYNENVMHQADYGKRDSIGRTLDALLAYKDKRFFDGILSCWRFDGKYWRGKRYPTDYDTEVPISRDHVYNTIIAIKKSLELGFVHEGFYKHFISHQPKKLSGFAKQTLSMNLWLSLLQGKSVGRLYYLLTYISLKAYKVWNKFIYSLTGIGHLGFEMHQDDFKPILIFPRAKILDFLTGLLFPNYALMSIGSQINILDDKVWVDKIKKEAWDLIPKYNYVGKLLFDHPDGVTQEEVDNYKPMIGDRWSDVLNPWINYGRNIHKLDESWLGENELDKDLLRSLFEERKNKQTIAK